MDQAVKLKPSLFKIKNLESTIKLISKFKKLIDVHRVL